jgi:hypothetical protein
MLENNAPFGNVLCLSLHTINRMDEEVNLEA